MAVTIRRTNGEPLEFPKATSAVCIGRVFHVQRWDPEFRRHEDLDSSTVIQAEIVEGGELVRVVVGRGQKAAGQ